MDQYAAIDVDRARTASRTAADISWVPCSQVGGNPCRLVTRGCRCPRVSLLQASPDPVLGARGPECGHDPSVQRTCLRRLPDMKPTGWTAYRPSNHTGKRACLIPVTPVYMVDQPLTAQPELTGFAPDGERAPKSVLRHRIVGCVQDSFPDDEGILLQEWTTKHLPGLATSSPTRPARSTTPAGSSCS